MKPLLQFFGVLSLIGAIIALIVHFNAVPIVRNSGIFISMFASGLLQFIVFFALSEIIQKLDSIIKINKNNETLDNNKGITIIRDREFKNCKDIIIDGNVYKTATIGTQEWTAENLNVEHYRNGDLVPQVQDQKEWSKLTTGAWCYYDNESKNGPAYSKLYNWYAVNDPRGLALEGWHIPSDAEWTKLTDNLGNEAGGKLKATTLWESPNTGATNESGFTAFPGGVRLKNGNFSDIGEYGYFWSASDFLYTAWDRNLGYGSSDVGRNYDNKRNGLSIRCVRD